MVEEAAGSNSSVQVILSPPPYRDHQWMEALSVTGGLDMSGKTARSTRPPSLDEIKIYGMDVYSSMRG